MSINLKALVCGIAGTVAAGVIFHSLGPKEVSEGQPQPGNPVSRFLVLKVRQLAEPFVLAAGFYIGFSIKNKGLWNTIKNTPQVTVRAAIVSYQIAGWLCGD